MQILSLVRYFLLSILVVSLIDSPSWAEFVQPLQLPDDAVPQITMKDMGLDLQARILVAIHEGEKYNGLTFRWCTYNGFTEECRRYLGCRPPGWIYTFEELNRERHRLWRKTGIILGTDLLIVAGIILGTVYATKEKEVQAGAEIIERGMPEAVNRLGTKLAHWREIFGVIAGISVLGISFSGLMGKLIAHLDPALTWEQAQLVSWDMYHQAYLGKQDILRNLKSSAEELNVVLCDIDEG